MVVDLAINVITALLELAWLSILLGIPFIVVGVAIRFFTSKIMNRFGISFVQASFIATYGAVLILISFAYFYPLYTGFAESPLTHQPKPPQLAITTGDLLAATPALILRTLWLTFLFSVLIIPLEFVASFAGSVLGDKFSLPSWARVVTGSLVSSLITVSIVLFVFPFSVSGLIYLLYFS